jgi:secreted trypsin-like serine protease
MANSKIQEVITSLEAVLSVLKETPSDGAKYNVEQVTKMCEIAFTAGVEAAARRLDGDTIDTEVEVTIGYSTETFHFSVELPDESDLYSRVNAYSAWQDYSNSDLQVLLEDALKPQRDGGFV